MRGMIVAGVVGAVLGLQARAEVVISNFSAAVGVGTAFGGTATTLYKAFGFTMGSADYELDSVELSMNFGGLGTPRVTIWTGAAAPTTEVFVLDNPPVLTGQTDFTFTAPSSFLLQAGETYWVHVVAVPVSGGPSFLWDGTTPSTVPSGLGAIPVGYIFNGASSTFRNRLQVNGTAGGGCYADCNEDGALTVSDFGCFQTRFVAGDPYADCNGDGQFTVPDFGCFQTLFVVGCP